MMNEDSPPTPAELKWDGLVFALGLILFVILGFWLQGLADTLPQENAPPVVAIETQVG
jgi:hypothetical protein